MENKLIEAAVKRMDKLSEASGLPQAHKTAKTMVKNSEGTGKAKLHPDGSASVHFKNHPAGHADSEKMAGHVMRTFGLGKDKEIKTGHKETQTGIHGTREFHLEKHPDGGHVVHIKPVSDTKLPKKP
jgi:hypothetical protein